MLGDGVRDALGFVSGEAGAEQVVGVGGVAVGAGGADRGAAVAARGQDGPGAFEQDGAVAVEDLGGAGQVDGGGAAAGGLDLGAPAAGSRGRAAGRRAGRRRAGRRPGGREGCVIGPPPAEPGFVVPLPEQLAGQVELTGGGGGADEPEGAGVRAQREPADRDGRGQREGDA